MKPHLSLHNIFSILCVIFIFNYCTEQPITSSLKPSLKVDTLLINNLNVSTYSIPPNLAVNERLYLGVKDGLNIPFSFIKISSSNIWDYYNDSTVIIDSVQFKLYYADSLQGSDSRTLQLYFSPDSHFNENLSTYLDFQEFSINEWYYLGTPDIYNKYDTSDVYSHSELIWDVDSLMHLLSDSGITRTFVIKYPNSDSNFIELFSEEATTGDKDPKIFMSYRKTNIFSSDSITIDTLSNSIYSSADLSIFVPTGLPSLQDRLEINNGAGKRLYLMFPFNSNSLMQGSIIQSANLIMPIDSISLLNDFNIIIDPILNDSLIDVDTSNFFIEDPFENLGYPYRISSTPDSLEYVVSIKNILQNIFLGNINNYGFKIVSEEKNYPFDSVWFSPNDSLRLPKIEIIYIRNED